MALDQTREDNDFLDLTVHSSTQIALEETFSKYQTLPFLRQGFLQSGFGEYLEEAEIPVPFGIDLLAQMVLHKRASIPTLVGILQRFFKHQDNPGQACADMIEKAARLDFVDWSDLAQQVIVIHDIDDATKHRMDLFQYPLPMIEEPSEITNNWQTGYRTIRGSLILKNNHTDEDICLDHINRSNRVPLAINMDVVAFVENRWANIDKKKPDESQEDFERRRKAFEKFTANSISVIQALSMHSRRFWLTHKYDKRGRCYAQGYHVNYQGNDWQKAMIEFADAEPLNKE